MTKSTAKIEQRVERKIAAALIEILDPVGLSFKSLVLFEGLASKGWYMPPLGESEGLVRSDL